MRDKTKQLLVINTGEKKQSGSGSQTIVNQYTSYGAGGGGNVVIEGVDISLLATQILNQAKPLFLSKLTNDEAEGVIDFLNGLKVGGNLVDAVLLAADESELTDTQLMTAAKIAKYVDDEMKKLDDRFLRKDQDDTAKGVITFENQIKSHDFAQGNLMGAGWSIYRDGNGNVVVETDRMIIRKDLSVSELIVNQETFQKGSTIYVKGGCTITRVEETDTYYRCYFDNKDGEEFSGFVVGDQARCQRYDKSYQNVIKYYWRLVVGVGDDYVDLSKTDADGTGLPTEGDDIAQLGNQTDKTRRSAVVISPDSGGSVVIWAGINSFNLSEKNMIGMGVDASTGEAYFYGYGNMYMGDRNQTSFMRFTKNNGVEICGSLAVGTKLDDGRDLKEAIDSATPEGYQEFVDAVTKSLGDLQNQVDGAVDSFFLDYDPTLTNYPANEWTTDKLKEAHLGDTYTNNESGDSWRWGKDSSGKYAWIYIEDTATKKALAAASSAQAAADGKMKVFITTPKLTDAYDVGDLWVNATYGQYKNDILRCNTAKAAGVSFSINHWGYASNYANKDSVNQISVSVDSLASGLNELGTNLDAVKQQVDKEYTIWFFDYTPTLNNYPASEWTTTELKDAHDQDMFYYREEGLAWRFENGKWNKINDQDILRALEQIKALQEAQEDFVYLQDAFSKDETVVVGGMTMGSFVGVRNSSNEVEACINGSDFAKDSTHGKLLLAGGIPTGSGTIEERIKKALTRIYEDGYLYTQNMKAKGAILEAIRVSSAVIEGDLTLGDTHTMVIQPTDGAYPAIVWDTNLLKLGLELINGNVSGLVQLGDLYGLNTMIRPNSVDVSSAQTSQDNPYRNQTHIEAGLIQLFSKNHYPTPVDIKVNENGKLVIYSPSWLTESEATTGQVFKDGSGYLKIKG